MAVIKCSHCGYDNYIFDDDKEPVCQICDSSLEPIKDDVQPSANYDEIPF